MGLRACVSVARAKSVINAVADTLLIGATSERVEVSDVVDDLSQGSPTVWLSTERWRQVVESAPELQFAIEYKLKEPRNHMTLSTAARTLLGIEEIGAPNLGIVLDMGHSLFAKETPADVLQLVHRRGRLVSVEVNDNLREWDDDMVVGSVHPVETLGFLWALRKIGWQKPILLDQFPFREDPVGAATLSIKAIEGMERLLDRIDKAALDDAMERQDALAAQAIVLKEIVGAG